MSEVKNVDLCMFCNGKYYKITVPKKWLKKNPSRSWQTILPENVKSMRISECLYGIDPSSLDVYQMDNYLVELFKNY